MGKENTSGASHLANPKLSLDSTSVKIGSGKTPIVSSISFENKKVTIGKK